MKPEFPTERLRCPICHADRALSLTAAASDSREVREGTLRCAACASEFPVRRGVAELLHDPRHHISREAAGLERFAELMRNDGWDAERIRSLPYVESGYWYVQAASMEQLFREVELRPGASLLDVGANTCWASNRFAQAGLKVVALDIATAELQGLHTADYFIEPGISYFERVLGSMDAMPLASESLDFVFCCEVLHHNDPGGLRRTFEEIHRVLKPGGKLLMVNETLKTAKDPVGVHLEGVAQFDGYEHAHWAAQYRWEAIRLGFATRLLEPQYHPLFRSRPRLRLREPLRRGWREQHSLRGATRTLAVELAQSTDVGRRAAHAWLLHVAGGAQMSMIATKPARAVGADPGHWLTARRVARSLTAATAESLRRSARR